MYEQHERNFSIYVVRLSVTQSLVTQSLTAALVTLSLTASGPRHKVLRGGGLCGILIYFFFLNAALASVRKHQILYNTYPRKSK